MKQQRLEQLKQELEARKKELKARLSDDEASGEVVELDQARMGRLSRVDAMQAQQMALEAARRHRRELRHIANALARVESGDYGVCTECGEDIDPRRLEIDPAAACCIECAQ